MSDFKQYQRKQIAELRPYKDGEQIYGNVSISKVDEDNGSPKVGDMIARNPKNHNDQWLVAEQYFKENFEELPPTPPSPIEITDEDIRQVFENTFDCYAGDDYTEMAMSKDTFIRVVREFLSAPK